MTFFGRIMCLSTAVVLVFGEILLLKRTLATDSSECSNFEFSCESNECIDAVLWCDTFIDCLDGSDEKYCKKSTLFNENPNNCLSTHFKCRNGMCIPITGRCDGHDNCDDSSDEMNCINPTQTSQESTPLSLSNCTTAFTTDTSPKTEIVGSIAVRFFDCLNASQNSVQVEQFLGLRFSDFSDQRNKARNWIFSQKRGDYGWGDETHRAITALYLSYLQPIITKTPNDILMIKQLEIQLSLDLLRNYTKTLKLPDLALYINALLLSCKNPKNFYGNNLVNTLRDAVNAAQREEKFINPSIYLTLCLNNVTSREDIKKLHDIFLSRNTTVSRIDMQALTLLAAACIFRNTNVLNSSFYDTYENIKMEFLRSVKVHGFPGNVYEAALLFQALQEMKITLTGLTDFILNQQLVDGSFGDILSTYLVLPILAGKSILQANEQCGQRKTPDLLPLEVLNNVRSRKIHVQYSLNYGFPPELTQTLQMHVAKGANVLDIMRLAQEINPKYQFKLSKNHDFPVVYSIGEMPNDVEKGMCWTIYKAIGNNSVIANDEHWLPFFGDIRNMILEDGDKVLFWYRPIETS